MGAGPAGCPTRAAPARVPPPKEAFPKAAGRPFPIPIPLRTGNRESLLICFPNMLSEDLGEGREPAATGNLLTRGTPGPQTVYFYVHRPRVSGALWAAAGAGAGDSPLGRGAPGGVGWGLHSIQQETGAGVGGADLSGGPVRAIRRPRSRPPTLSCQGRPDASSPTGGRDDGAHKNGPIFRAVW